MASSTSSLPRQERMPTWVTRACSGPRAGARPRAPPATTGGERPGAERATDAAAVYLGMEAPEVGAGVDDLDLRGGDPGGDEPPPDGLAHGDDGGPPARGIPPGGAAGPGGGGAAGGGR